VERGAGAGGDDLGGPHDTEAVADSAGPFRLRTQARRRKAVPAAGAGGRHPSTGTEFRLWTAAPDPSIDYKIFARIPDPRSRLQAVGTRSSGAVGGPARAPLPDSVPRAEPEMEVRMPARERLDPATEYG